MFSEHCENPFTYEPVEVEYIDDITEITPDLSTRQVESPVELINEIIRVKLVKKKKKFNTWFFSSRD